MNEPNMNFQEGFKYKKIIVFMSWIALILLFMNSLGYCISGINGEYYFNILNIFQNIDNLIFTTLKMSPSVLLVLYVSKFYEKSRGTVLIPIIFALIAIYYLYNLISMIDFGFGGIIYDLISCILFILTIITSSNGLLKKHLVFLAILSGFISEILIIINARIRMASLYFEEGLSVYWVNWLVGDVGTIALYVALLLFSLKNRIPTVIRRNFGGTGIVAEQMSPEQALKVLKSNLEHDLITKEEYEAKRKEIINEL